jgi:hypothetical protein
MAFVAYHFPWERDTILDMPHRERARWCEEISRINDRLNDQGGDPDEGMVLEQSVEDAFEEW